MHASDDAGLAARVARQPGVSNRRVVTRDDVFAEREAGRRPGSAKWGACLQIPHYASEELGVRVWRRRIGPIGQLGHAALQRLERDHALLDEQPQAAIEPPLIVARADIVNRDHPLYGVAGLVAVEQALTSAGGE